ncbi:hypothetical protein ACJU26_09655 [Acidithiobacillus sp. M4-SHS-6]|uniref:hypothetical protein n=1 Tax=Acidithiobacillus sp. M4-SHS-6 TaxID=3383024 RepID=UPI0039BE1B5C
MLGLLLWVFLIGAWTGWLFRMIPFWVLLILDPIFAVLAMSQSNIPLSFFQELQRGFDKNEEREAWLTFFERQHPELVALPPWILPAQPISYMETLFVLAGVLFPLFPMGLQLVLSGNAMVALRLTLCLTFAFITAIPMIRWTGILVGGRYAWWAEYHWLRTH